MNLETQTDQSTTQMARDEREGGASSGNDDDEADAAAATAVLEGTLSLHNTFMDVVIRYLYVLHTYLYRTTIPELELLLVKLGKLCQVPPAGCLRQLWRVLLLSRQGRRTLRAKRGAQIQVSQKLEPADSNHARKLSVIEAPQKFSTPSI